MGFGWEFLFKIREKKKVFPVSIIGTMLFSVEFAAINGFPYKCYCM